MYHSSWREKTLDDETVVAALLDTLFAWAGELSLENVSP
jgi:hypothetical protein